MQNTTIFDPIHRNPSDMRAMKDKTIYHEHWVSQSQNENKLLHIIHRGAITLYC